MTTALLPRPTRTATPVPPPAAALVVPLGAADRAPLHRAAAAAAATGAPLHLVVRAPRRPSPWAVAAGLPARRPAPSAVDLAQAAAARLRAGGLHVEVHATTGRPERLAREIARTLAGRVVH